MQSICRLVAIQILFVLMVGCSSFPWSGSDVAESVPLNLEAVAATEIKNLINPAAGKFVSGQPTEEQLEALAKAGVQHIVNLRTAEEMENLDEESIVESLGMSYYNLPVDGNEQITIGNAKSLRKILNSIGDEPVLMHDGSGGRVGALMAIDSALENGADVDQAILTGKDWGLSGRILPAVKVALAE